MFKCGDIQHTSHTPDKKTENRYTWKNFLRHHMQDLQTFKTLKTLCNVIFSVKSSPNKFHCMLFNLFLVNQCLYICCSHFPFVVAVLLLLLIFNCKFDNGPTLQTSRTFEIRKILNSS